MTHPDEGTLLALRDGEPITQADRVHIAECSTCSALLDDARARAETVRRVLHEDGDEIDIARAKAAVRDRLDRNTGRPSSPLFASGLRRAAAILLVAAGAVSALPSSPVRAWLSGGSNESPEGTTEGAAATSPDTDTRSIGVPAQSGLVIAFSGAEPGTPISLAFRPQDAVGVSAAEGTRFAVADNRVDASEVVGPVVIRVPEDAPSLTITVDGRMMFRGTMSEFEVDASGVQADGGWVFRVPDR